MMAIMDTNVRTSTPDRTPLYLILILFGCLIVGLLVKKERDDERFAARCEAAMGQVVADDVDPNRSCCRFDGVVEDIACH